MKRPAGNPVAVGRPLLLLLVGVLLRAGRARAGPSLATAGAVTNLAMWVADRIARLLFTHFDAAKCSLPSVLPWPDPPGNSAPFDVAVPEASAEQLGKFLAFRGVALPATEAARREAAAREAVSYMAELFDRKHNEWCYRHYALKEKGLSV